MDETRLMPASPPARLEQGTIAWRVWRPVLLPRWYPVLFLVCTGDRVDANDLAGLRARPRADNKERKEMRTYLSIQGVVKKQDRT